MDGERNEVRCQAGFMGAPDHWGYKKNEICQRTSSPWGINIRRPNLGPPSLSLPGLSLSFVCRTCGGRDVTLMSARVLSVDKLPTVLWRDKLSRLIISLSLTARQLIKAPQGSIISSFSSPALSAGGVRPLMGWGGWGVLEMTSWAWADSLGQEAKLVQTRIHDWACTNVSVAKTKAREKEARQRKQGEKMTVKAAETALLSQRIVVP